MKILHVVPTYLPAYRYGGPIQSVHALNKHLVRAHVEVVVYTTAIDGPEDLDVPISTWSDLWPVDRDGVQVCYFKPGRMRSWFYSPDMRRALAEHAKDFDIVHITSVFLSASTLAARAARAANKPYIISPRGSLMLAPLEKKSRFKKSIYMSLVERRNLENADAIHFTTEPEKLEYEKLGYRLRQSVVIPNGLDPDSLSPGDPEAFRKKFGIGPEQRIVLFLGRLSWKKGLDTLIPAFAEVTKEFPDAVLVVAGVDGENYRPTLDKLVASSGLQEKVIFTGSTDSREKTEAFRNADVFVLPSYSENFAVTVAESMYFGVPVVISEEVGLAKVVRESESGLVVQKEVGAVAEAIASILRDPALARAMGEKGISTAANNFSYEKVAEAFLSAYNGIISSH